LSTPFDTFLLKTEIITRFLINQLAILRRAWLSCHIIQSFVRKCQSFNKPLNSPSSSGSHYWHFAGFVMRIVSVKVTPIKINGGTIGEIFEKEKNETYHGRGGQVIHIVAVTLLL
jgi:hypothetical protein